jgi:hypothetical protein
VFKHVLARAAVVVADVPQVRVGPEVRLVQVQVAHQLEAMEQQHRHQPQ